MISEAAQKIRSNLVRDVLDETPIAQKRELWENSARNQLTPAGTSVRDVSVGGVPCLLCVPDKQTSGKAIVYCHGGGLVEGSVETTRVWASRLALHTGCRVLCVGYRLAPEYKYPAAVEDVLLVCRTLLDSPEFPVGYCIGADSSGCILALAVIQRLKPDQGSKPDCLFLLSPSIDLTFSGASIEKNAMRDPLVSIEVLKYCAIMYAGSESLGDPHISPLFADYRNMPPIFVMVDENEILLDDSVRLVQKVLSSGGVAQLCVSQGLWHVWPCWGEFPESTIAIEMIRRHILHPGLYDPTLSIGKTLPKTVFQVFLIHVVPSDPLAKI